MSDDEQREQILRPAELERLRAGFRLEMTSEGRFVYEGSPVAHPRVVDYFRRHIACDSLGRPVLQVGRQTAPLRVSDCSYRVRHVRVRDAGLQLELDDGRSLSIVPSDLRISGTTEFGLFALVRPRFGEGRLAARFNNAALAELAPVLHLEEASSAFLLEISGATVKLAHGQPPETSASW